MWRPRLPPDTAGLVTAGCSTSQPPGALDEFPLRRFSAEARWPLRHTRSTSISRARRVSRPSKKRRRRTRRRGLVASASSRATRRREFFDRCPVWVTASRSEDFHLVEIHPEKNGTPPAAELSAANWVRAQNRRMSVLAPVYLPMPTVPLAIFALRRQAMKRSLAPYGYAVLAYADAYHRPSPGQPDHGASANCAAQVRACANTGQCSVCGDYHRRFTISSLTYSRSQSSRPKGRALASDLARSGKPAAAAVVAIKPTTQRCRQRLANRPFRRIGRRDHAAWLGRAGDSLQILLLFVTGHGRQTLVLMTNLGRNTRAAIKSLQTHARICRKNDIVDNATFAALTRAVGSRQAVVSMRQTGRRSCRRT